MPKRVRDAEFDEVSTVATPANQHGLIVLAKSTRQEERVGRYFDLDGEPVDEADIAPGDIVADENGQLFQAEGAEDDDAEGLELAEDAEGELVGVGKSVASVAEEVRTGAKLGRAYAHNAASAGAGAQREATRTLKQVHAGGKARRAGAVGGFYGAKTTPRQRALHAGVAGGAVGGAGYEAKQHTSKSIAAEVAEALSKAVNDTDRAEVVSKAVEELAQRYERAEEVIAELTEVAKGERNLRRTAEFVEVAKSYNVPVDADELGPVLMRCSDALSYEDCVVLNKALTASGQMLFEQAGYDGEALANDPFAEVEAFIAEGRVGSVSKSGTREPVSKEAAAVAFFESNPAAYDQYLRARGNG